MAFTLDGYAWPAWERPDTHVAERLNPSPQTTCMALNKSSRAFSHWRCTVRSLLPISPAISAISPSRARRVRLGVQQGEERVGGLHAARFG